MAPVSVAAEPVANDMGPDEPSVLLPDETSTAPLEKDVDEPEVS